MDSKAINLIIQFMKQLYLTYFSLLKLFSLLVKMFLFSISEIL